MIKPEDAQAMAGTMVDDSLKGNGIRDRLIEGVAKIDPSLLTENGDLDIGRLSTIMNADSSRGGLVGYELQFVGKNTAIYEADTKRSYE